MKLVVFTDGASRGNPGPASYGFTIETGDGKLLFEKGKYIGIATNNVAEYSAVLSALELIKEKFHKEKSVEINFYADSKLVVEQLSGRYKIKSPHLRLIIEDIKVLEKLFNEVSYNHVPREQNTEADSMANKALDSL